MRRGATAIGFVVLVLVATGAAGADQVNMVYLPVIRGPWPEVHWATVVSVSDGDTIRVDLDDCPLEGVRVRYVLVDTPERGQCYWAEARDRNRELVEGRRIGLERDASEWDSWGRLLRYPWAADSGDVGAVLIREGLGRVAIYDDTRHLCQYLELQELAIAEDAGIWGACQYPTPTPYPGCGE